MSSSSLLTARRFWPMFWTQFSVAFNDNLFKNALVILIAYRSDGALGLGSDQLVAIAGALFMLPYLFVSALAGQLADKWEKAHFITLIKGAEIAIMTTGGLALVSQRVEFLLAVLFFMGMQSAFFGPVKYSILPQLLPEEDDLVAGNALVELATYVAILAGTILGGLLVNLEYGGNVVGHYVVGAGVAVTAVIGFAISRMIPRGQAVDPDLALRFDPFVPTWDTIKLTWKSDVVWRSVLAITWFWGFGAAFLSLFPPWTKNVLHGSEAIATLFLACFSVGIGIGSMLCERLSRHRLELGLVPIGSFGMSLFTFDLFLVGEPWSAPANGELLGLAEFLSRWQSWRLIVDLFGISGFAGLFIVPLYTLLQQRPPPEERSRVIAGNNVINSAFIVALSLVIAQLQGLGFTSPQIFAVLALINTAVAIHIYTVVPEFMLRFMAWMLSNVMYRVQVKGLEKIPREGPFVLVCNHVSYVDWLLIGGAIKRPLRFVMYHGFAKVPVFGWFVRQARVIPIAPAKESIEVKEAAFTRISQQLREGWGVGIFPEGTLTKDGDLLPFRPGIEHILERDPVPVVPVALNGMWGSWFSRADGGAFKKKPRAYWAKVEIVIEDPIPPDGLTAQQLEARVREIWERGAP